MFTLEEGNKQHGHGYSVLFISNYIQHKLGNHFSALLIILIGPNVFKHCENGLNFVEKATKGPTLHKQWYMTFAKSWLVIGGDGWSDITRSSHDYCAIATSSANKENK